MTESGSRRNCLVQLGKLDMPNVVDRQESGNISLYAAVILPIVVSLSVVAVDVSNFQSLRDAAQQEADRIALQAAAALPDTHRAELLLHRAVSSLAGFRLALSDEQAAALRVSSSSVELVLEGSVPAVFDIFLRLQGSSGHVFTLREKANVQIVPGDYVIIVADASTLRPRPGSAWGSEQSWPASRYFNFSRPPEVSLVEAAETAVKSDVFWSRWWEAWTTNVYRRWATQACYNPVFSGLKLAAISVIDVLGAIETNRLSLIFTPGDEGQDGFSVLRPLGFMKQDVSGPEAVWPGYFESEDFVSDESCVYFADAEASGDTAYGIPQAPVFSAKFAARQAECSDRIDPLKGAGPYYYPYNALAECFTGSAIKLREALYFHAARKMGHSPGALNIVYALDQAYLQLVLANDEAQHEEKKRRGNLSGESTRKIFVFSDQLPDPQQAEFRAAISRLEQAEIDLVLVAFLPLDQLASEHEMVERRENLERTIDQYTNLNAAHVKVLPVWSSRDLPELVVPKIIAAGKEFAVRS